MAIKLMRLKCTSCRICKAAKFFSANKNKLNGKQSHCRVCANARRKAKRDVHGRPDMLKWKAAHPGAAAKASSEWQKRNPGVSKARTKIYEVAKLKAMPNWADKAKILKIYQRAAVRGMHVDHIVPLRSKLVCGLHCEHNLQLLTPLKNLIKGNRTWPDMP